MTETVIRPAVALDAEFLWDVLVEVAKAPYYRRGRAELLADPGVRHYLEGWPRHGDLGVLAEIAGVPVGAAWLRTFDTAERSDGFVRDGVPELAVGVLAGHRGRGIGRALLRAVTELAASSGVRHISLSVDRPNPAVALYLAEGYRIVRERPQSYVMLLDLDHPVRTDAPETR